MRSTRHLKAGRGKLIRTLSITTDSPRAHTSQLGNSRNTSSPRCESRSSHCANQRSYLSIYMSDKQILLTQRSPEYWRVTINHPPLNIFGPDTIPQLNEAITAVETDEHVKVVVFDSAVEGFFLTHYDFLAKVEDTTSLPPGPTG